MRKWKVEVKSRFQSLTSSGLLELSEPNLCPLASALHEMGSAECLRLFPVERVDVLASGFFQQQWRVVGSE